MMDNSYKYGLVMDILEATHDGDDLEQCELKLLECGINHQLSPLGENKLYQIYYRTCVEKALNC